jgi:DNA-binding PucR family transcriptional regulator
MIDAVLAGGGVEPVAALAAERLGGTVAIVLPAVDVEVGAPPRLSRYVADRLLGRPARVPRDVVAEVPVHSGDELLGYVALLDAEHAEDAPEILELAAVAVLTAVTLRDANVARRRAAAALLDDLRAGEDIVARARRLGSDLADGASALSVRPEPGQTERVLALIAQEIPGALAAPRGDRVDALLPGDPAAARRLAQRLGTSGLSPTGRDLAAALRYAELALELGREDALHGSWRLLLAADPAERRALVDSTVGPASELLDTLRAYLDHGANMNATAGAVYAHRHTVAARLERIRALTGHDPLTPAGQAQLTLGLQALDVQRAAERLA